MTSSTDNVNLAAVFSDASSANKALDSLEGAYGSSERLSLLMRERTAERELSVGEAADVDLQLPLGAGALRLASELQPVIALAPDTRLMVAGPLTALIEKVAQGSTLELAEVLQRCGVADEKARLVSQSLKTGGVLVAAEGDDPEAAEQFREATIGSVVALALKPGAASLSPDPAKGGSPAAKAPMPSASAGARAPGASERSLQPSESAVPLEASPQEAQSSQVGAIPPGESDAEVGALPAP